MSTTLSRLLWTPRRHPRGALLIMLQIWSCSHSSRKYAICSGGDFLQFSLQAFGRHLKLNASPYPFCLFLLTPLLVSCKIYMVATYRVFFLRTSSLEDLSPRIFDIIMKFVAFDGERGGHAAHVWQKFLGMSYPALKTWGLARQLQALVLRVFCNRQCGILQAAVY